MTLAPGTTLARRWQITGALAVGGMSEVYRAEDTKLGRQVALKVLRAGLVDGAARFDREIETLSQLQHRNIVTLFDIGEHGGLPFFVMELVEGSSLADVVARGPLPSARVRRIGSDVASALAYAHQRDIVHRDVKPANVLFGEDGTARLADFGIAHLADRTALTATGSTIGTATYIAPEQLTGEGTVGPAADVYALGLVLLESATGHRAFPGTPTEAALARLAGDPSIPDHLPGGWRRLLAAMTARDPAERPLAAAVASALESGSVDEGTETMPVASGALDQTSQLATVTETSVMEEPHRDTDPRQRVGVPGVRSRRLVVAAVVALFVVAGALFAAFGPRSGEEPGLGPAQASPETELPAEVDEAFERLRQSVGDP